jgi:hypothetical protein
MLSAASRLGFGIPKEHEVDYMELLGRTDHCVDLIMAEPGEFLDQDDNPNS